MKKRITVAVVAGSVALGLATTAIVTATNASASTEGPVACTQQDLSAAAAWQGAARGFNRALLNIRNVSDHDCVIGGRAAIRLVNAAMGTASLPTTGVAQPGEATLFTVKAGGGAFQGIKWRACDKGDLDCAAGNSLQWKYDTRLDDQVDLTPERESEGEASGFPVRLDGFPAPERSAITMASLQIGTMQPSNQGVVAW
jgi:uncharacterized protein DUF4232